MKKFTLILSLLVAMVTTAMGQINVSTTEGAPEHRYILRNANNKFVTSTTGMTGEMNEAGHFAFYSAGVDNAYYIYSINENKWVTYEIASAYDNTQNFVTLSDTKGDDDKFYFRAYNNGDYYDIAPYNTTDIAGKYLNWYQGGGSTLGIWQQGANVDTGSKWFLEEEITSIDKLSNDKVYFLQSSRGHLLYNSGNAEVVGSSKKYNISLHDDASLWAIYKSPDTEKYYFYNIAADKFIGQNSDEGGRFPFVEKPTNDIQIVSSTKDGYPFVFSTDNYGAINHFGDNTAEPGVANWKGNANAGGLRALDDDGSAHRVYSVKTLSQDEKARIANLVSAFENIEVVYNFTYNGNTIATQTSAAKNGDATYPDITVTFPFGVSATKPVGSVTASDAENTQTFDIEVVLNLPFQISELDQNGKFGSDMHWYKMTLKGKDVRCQDYKSIANATYDVITPNDLYAFTGNPFDGFKIYNMIAGSSKVLWSNWFDNSANPIPMTPVDSVTEGTDWLLNANRDGYGFKRKGTDNAYVNSREETFSYWNHANGKTDNGSRITFTEKDADVNTIAESYKNDVLTTLDIWAACFDVATVKDNINNTDAEGGALVEFINDALASIFADKYFTIRNADQNTGSVRYNTYLSAKSNSKNEAYGETHKDNDAIWTFKLFGKDFYLYNVKNNVYLGTPGSNGDLMESPTALYYFDSAIAQEGVSVDNALELHCGSETLHMNNHNSSGNRNDRFLSSHDNDYASCWYIGLYEEHFAMIEAALVAEENNHAEAPGLGQYTTAAYNALQQFSENDSYTLEEAIVALDAFNRAKNRPLYYIEGQISYAEGKAIYEENTPDNLKFKEINVYDRTMLWAMDQATETVATTDNVVLTNYASTNGFWGADYISIIETEPAVENDGIFMFKTNGTDNPVHAQETNSVIVRWSSTEANTVGGGSTWKFVYVGNSYDIDKLTDEKIEALLALKAAHSAKTEFYQNAVIGDAIGQYNRTSEEAFDAILAAGEGIYSASLTDQALKSIEAINEAKTNINNATLTINQPATNKYYRIKGADENQNPSGHYITGNTNSDGGRIALKAEDDASTIYYLNENNKLAAYQSGLYIGLNNNHYVFATIDGTKPASDITFAESPRKAGIYTIKSADRYLHYKVYNNAAEIDRCQNDAGHTAHDWIIEEVTTLPVTISTVGYATFYAPVAVVIPAEVKAWYLATKDDVNENKITMTPVTGNVIPANTGVILEGLAGTYNFDITEETGEAITSLLTGTVAATYVTEEAYVLSAPDGDVANLGLYTAAFNQSGNTAFKNNSHKAYLPKGVLSPEVQNSNGFRFDFDGTTAVEDVEVENEEGVKVIYDLAGRKLDEITAPGVYIVNGKKLIIR